MPLVMPLVSAGDPRRLSVLSALGLASAVLAPLAAQDIGRDPFLLGGQLSAGGSIDRAGVLRPLVDPARGDVRYAPDGSYWIPSTLTGQLTRVRFGQPVIRANVGIPFLDFCVTPEGHALVAIANPRNELVELDLQGQRVRTIPLIGGVQSVEVDELGRAWVAVANNPAPLIQVVPRTGGAGGTLAAPPALTVVRDILADGRAGGSHVYVCGENTNLVQEYDRQLNLVRTLPIGDFPATGVDDLELAPDGSVWARQRARGLFRIDPATGVASNVIARPVDLFGFDAEGGLWVVSRRSLYKVEVDGVQLGAITRVTGLQEGYLADDPGGLFAATVLDPNGDADGDQVRNRDEVRIGTNWLDAYSTPTLELDTRLEATGGGDLVLRARGAPALGYVVLATGITPPTPIPGIENGLLLSPGSLLGGLLAVTVPGELRVPLPPINTSAVVWAQVIRFPLIGNPRFSDAEALRFGPAPIGQISETFSTATRRDTLRSGAGWLGTGFARPVAVGGRGILGSFDPTVGSEVEPGVFEFNTDDQLFPAAVTLFERDVRVTDGVFEFSDFVLRAGVTVRFVGSKPAVLKVRGEVRIEGELSLAGSSPDPRFDAASPRQGVARDGQSGALGGAGAGAGGRGADGCFGDGALPRYSGRAGEPIQAAAGSGYAGLGAMTGGGGGPLFPASGLDADIQFNLFLTLSGQLAGGGGGGAFLGDGADGMAQQSFTTVASDLGPDSVGGTAVPFRLAPAGISSLGHYLVGGAGGGGGGSQPFGLSRTNIAFEQREWHAGGGGAGGGGAVAVRSGARVDVGPSGRISVAGGSGVEYTPVANAVPSPGGGGAGGSLLIQSARLGGFGQRGVLDVRGGSGGTLRFTAINGATAIAVGGAGGNGYIRVEEPAVPSPAVLGRVAGLSPNVDNVGVLTDRDAWSGVQSVFEPAATLGAPDWLNYTIDAVVDGQRVVYSDDSANFNPANRPGEPIRFFVQGAKLDAAGEPLQVGPWREFVGGSNGLEADDADAVRFLILFDSSLGRQVEVDAVEIRYRD